jgi:hypothetical protein
MRGAVLPDSAPASPAMVVFALPYAVLGLDQQAVRNIAKNAEASQRVAASLADAMQLSYKERFPRSIMINNQLGEDFFALNLRSVLDFADEAASTRNRRMKMALAASGAVVLMAQYDGPPREDYDAAIAAGVREMIILPEQALRSVNPPFQPSPLDYALLCAAILAVFIFVRRLRRR